MRVSRTVLRETEGGTPSVYSTSQSPIGSNLRIYQGTQLRVSD